MDLDSYLQLFIETSTKNDLFLSSHDKMNAYLYNYYFNCKYPKYTSFIIRSEDTDYEHIANLLKTSSANIVCMSFLVDFGFGGHANLLIYRRNNLKHVLEHYEPHGIFETLPEIEKSIRKLHKSLLMYMPNLKFTSSSKLHKFYNGLQCLANFPDSEGGYCQEICHLIQDLVFKYKNKSTKEIILKIICHDRNLQQKSIEKRIREIVRGFYYLTISKIQKLINTTQNVTIANINNISLFERDQLCNIFFKSVDNKNYEKMFNINEDKLQWRLLKNCPIILHSYYYRRYFYYLYCCSKNIDK